jgi:hypothetical protein
MNDNIENIDMELFCEIEKEEYHHKSYGIMSKDEDGGWIDVTQTL